MLIASSQAAQHGAANSLLLLSLSARLIGQPLFHSTPFPLHLHIVCFPIDCVANGEFELERKLVTNVT